jgi:Type IV secretion-system coupling protein DNA-binding domain
MSLIDPYYITLCLLPPSPSPVSSPLNYLDMITAIAQVNFRDDKRVFGIKETDRFQHLYIIGKTGTGKSTLLQNMALQDFANGNGFCLIDPHGDMVSSLHERLGDIPHTYLDLSDPKCVYGYNPFKQVSSGRISLLASGFLETMKVNRSGIAGGSNS